MTVLLASLSASRHPPQGRYGLRHPDLYPAAGRPTFDLPAGESLFIDPEQGASLAATPADVREAYQETVLEAIEEWRARFASAGAFYEPISTNQPFGVPLRRAFAARQRRS